VVNEIPAYFTEDEVNKIFSTINNFKHYTILKILFYGCLRASELCDLDVSDIDLNDLTLHIRDGKGGKPAKVLINDECGRLLIRYLEIRPEFFEDHRQPLFFTEKGNRWNRHYLYQMFTIYKTKAGIKRKGGLHVFSRHTTATLMTAKGLDIRIVKDILRHEDIRTTLRYSHVADATKRKMYNEYLQL
jgi:integrase/recombinase XerD